MSCSSSSLSLGFGRAAAIILCFFFSITLVPASESSLVVTGPTTLQLSPSLIVENSPGVKHGTKVKCERVMINGVPRITNLKRFANSVKVNVSFTYPRATPPNIEICFHRNDSRGIGMCHRDHWEKLNKGFLVKTMSPFDSKILDIRMDSSLSETLQVSIYEEQYMHRICFLVLGIVMLTLASWASRSIIVYYSGAMVIGVLLVILMILFQGMKLVPTARRSFLGLFIYSCFVGVGYFLLGFIPGLLRSALAEIGVSEELHHPLAMLLLVLVVMAGACLGFLVVRKVVLTPDGSVDTHVAHFVTWSIRIIASLLILQSSADPLLAIEALLCGIFVSSVLKRSMNPKFIRRVYKMLQALEITKLGKSHRPYQSPFNSATSPSRTRTPIQGSESISPLPLSDSDNFYSTFHTTPDRKKLSKEEWDAFTKESTRKALKELVSSPDFSRWAVAHADRITLAPNNENLERRQRLFECCKQ